MILFLLSLLGLVRSFQKSRCKKLLKVTMARIQLLNKRREVQLRQLRRDVCQLMQPPEEEEAQFMQLRKEKKAQLWLGRVWKEMCLHSAYIKIEEYCQLVKINLTNIAGQRECPTCLAEPLASLFFAASCCADLPELQELREIFAMKYGRGFVISEQELQPDCRVNREFLESFYAKGPSAVLKQALLESIAKEYEANKKDTLQQGLHDSLSRATVVDCNEQNRLEVHGDGMDHLTTYTEQNQELDVVQAGYTETASIEDLGSRVFAQDLNKAVEEVCTDDEIHAEIAGGLHACMCGHGHGAGVCNDDANHLERINTANGYHTCIHGYDDGGSLQGQNTTQMMHGERECPLNQHQHAEVAMARAYCEPNESDHQKQIQLYVEPPIFSRPPQRPPPPPPPPKRTPPPPPLRGLSLPSHQPIENPHRPPRSSTLEHNHCRQIQQHHVHPRLPKYEDLVANFSVLKH